MTIREDLRSCNQIAQYAVVYLRMGDTHSPGRMMPDRDTSFCLYIYFTFSVFRYKTATNKKKEEEKRERDDDFFYTSCFSLSCSYARLQLTHRKIRISRCSSERSPASIDSPSLFLFLFRCISLFPSFLCYQAVLHVYYEFI